jgi:predicted GNAT family acetyltransferase
MHSALHSRTLAEVLDDSARPAMQRLLDTDPIVNAVVAARLRTARSLRPRALGGVVLGVRDHDDVVAACYNGGNLIPVGGDARTWDALGEALVRRSRVCSSIVGRSDAVAALWRVLSQHWPAARALRADQPLLVLDGPVTLEGDDTVRAARPADLDRYVSAAAAMFTEELGVSPHIAPGSEPFRLRVEDLIRTGRAFGSFDFRGQVIFKADLGAVTAQTCQIQGVWVRPDLRGRGIGTAALATVVRHALTLAPTVSLYVNDFNTAARRVYQKLGMHQHATLSTVLL